MSKVDTDKPEVATDEEVQSIRLILSEQPFRWLFPVDDKTNGYHATMERILARLDKAEAEVKTATDAHVALAQQFNEKCEDNATLKAEVERLRGNQKEATHE